MRPVDPSLQEALTRAGGTNLYGAPRFRIVWGRDRIVLIGGEWVNYDEHGNPTGTVAELREWPKYHPFNDYWYFEKWVPSSFYGSRTKWESQTYETKDGKRLPACGPYPERGDYELSWRCAVTKCPVHSNTADCLPSCTCKQYWEPLKPTLGIVENYVAVLMRSEIASSYERLKAIEREEERQRKETARVQDDIWRDTNQLFTGSYVSVPKHYDVALGEWRESKGILIPKE